MGLTITRAEMVHKISEQRLESRVTMSSGLDMTDKVVTQYFLDCGLE